jgi:hypothetical protein
VAGARLREAVGWQRHETACSQTVDRGWFGKIGWQRLPDQTSQTESFRYIDVICSLVTV